MKRALRIVLAAAAGLCFYGSFPPLGWWPLAIVGVALLVGVIEGRGLWSAFGLGFLAGMAFFVPLFDWVTIASGTWVAQAGLAVPEALFLAVTAAIWSGLMRGRYTGNTGYGRAISFAVTFAALEQLRAAWPFGGMPWGLLGFSQVDSPLLRLAPWGSVSLVTATAVAIGVLLEWALRHGVRVRLIRGFISLGSALAVLVATMFIPLSTASDSYITVGYAQGIVPREGLSWADQAYAVTRNLAAAGDTITPGSIDVLLWPESAADRDPRTDADVATVVNGVVARLKAPVLFGTQRFYSDYRYNDYVVWQSGGVIEGVYSKQHPVPFGEYMPMRAFLRTITSAVDQVTTDMRAGTRPATLSVTTASGPVVFATPICFEVAITSIVSEAVRDGAQIIVVPTNNASFGTSSESAQQFNMTRFRAVEQGRTAIQVSTVGISGIVEPNGVVTHRTEAWTEAAGTARVGLRSGLTFATRYSQQIQIFFYAVGGMCAAAALVLAARHRVATQSKKKRSAAPRRRARTKGTR